MYVSPSSCIPYTHVRTCLGTLDMAQLHMLHMLHFPTESSLLKIMVGWVIYNIF